jgi:hypothetical protein
MIHRQADRHSDGSGSGSGMFFMALGDVWVYIGMGYDVPDNDYAQSSNGAKAGSSHAALSGRSVSTFGGIWAELAPAGHAAAAKGDVRKHVEHTMPQ